MTGSICEDSGSASYTAFNRSRTPIEWFSSMNRETAFEYSSLRDIPSLLASRSAASNRRSGIDIAVFMREVSPAVLLPDDVADSGLGNFGWRPRVAAAAQIEVPEDFEGLPGGFFQGLAAMGKHAALEQVQNR